MDSWLSIFRIGGNLIGLETASFFFLHSIYSLIIIIQAIHLNCTSYSTLNNQSKLIFFFASLLYYNKLRWDYCPFLRIDDNGIIKVADFGLTEDVYQCNYFRQVSHSTKLPVKWMAPESIHDRLFSQKSDVVWILHVCIDVLIKRLHCIYSFI